MKVCCMKHENTGQRCTNEIPEKDEICSECCELLNDYLRGTSVKQIVELQMEVDDLVSLNHRLSDILDRTANALHGGPMDKGLWSFHDLPELAYNAMQENDKLRALLAQGQGDCIYCNLPAVDIAKCASGFPGCGRMDDIMNAQETEKDEQISHLRMSLLSARIEVEAILDNIPNAVRVREGGGDEDVYASLAVSVAKIQHRKG